MGVYISCEEYKIIKKMGWRERLIYLALRFEMDYDSQETQEISYEKLRHHLQEPPMSGKNKKQENTKYFHLRHSLKLLEKNGLINKISEKSYSFNLLKISNSRKNEASRSRLAAVSLNDSSKLLENKEESESYPQAVSQPSRSRLEKYLALIYKNKDIKKEEKNIVYGQAGQNMNNSETCSIHSNGQKIYNLFFDFWNLYPRKVKKENALKAWNQMKGDLNFDKIKKNLEERTDFKTREKKFIPHPATYLRGKMWEDEDLHDGPTKEAEEERVLRMEQEIAAERKAWRDKYGRLPWEPERPMR